MTRTTSMRARLSGVAALIAVGLLVAACGGSAATSGGNSAGGSGSGATATRAADSSLTIGVTAGAHGRRLIGSDGRTVYLWEGDRGGMSHCTGACAAAWPPVVATPNAGHGVIASKLGTVRRSGGARQVTYAGHPLYYFDGDTAAGQTNGQGSNAFGAKWWLVSPAGSAITTGSAGSGQAASSGGSSGSSGSSGSGNSSGSGSSSGSGGSGGGW